MAPRRPPMERRRAAAALCCARMHCFTTSAPSVVSPLPSPGQPHTFAHAHTFGNRNSNAESNRGFRFQRGHAAAAERRTCLAAEPAAAAREMPPSSGELRGHAGGRLQQPHGDQQAAERPGAAPHRRRSIFGGHSNEARGDKRHERHCGSRGWSGGKRRGAESSLWVRELERGSCRRMSHTWPLPSLSPAVRPSSLSGFQIEGTSTATSVQPASRSQRAGQFGGVCWTDRRSTFQRHARTHELTRQAADVGQRKRAALAHALLGRLARQRRPHVALRWPQIHGQANEAVHKECRLDGGRERQRRAPAPAQHGLQARGAVVEQDVGLSVSIVGSGRRGGGGRVGEEQVGPHSAQPPANRRSQAACAVGLPRLPAGPARKSRSWRAQSPGTRPP